MSADVNNGRSMAAILGEMKDEIQEFVQTRIELLKRELQEKISAIKSAIPAAIIGGLLLLTAFLLLSFALVALVAVGFGENPYRWFFGFLIVGVFWAIGGGMGLYMARRRLSQQGLVPRKTVEVLSGDKVWLQNETRSAL